MDVVCSAGVEDHCAGYVIHQGILNSGGLGGPRPCHGFAAEVVGLTLTPDRHLDEGLQVTGWCLTRLLGCSREYHPGGLSGQREPEAGLGTMDLEQNSVLRGRGRCWQLNDVLCPAERGAESDGSAAFLDHWVIRPQLGEDIPGGKGVLSICREHGF